MLPWRKGKKKKIIGKYGLGIRNTRGVILFELCVRNNLIITNTHFQHHKRRRYTQQALGDTRRAQIDYILIRGSYKNQVKDSKSYPGADIYGDHNIVLMHCELKFKKLQKKIYMKRFQLTNLKVEESINSYKENIDRAITETYDALSTISIEENWGNIKRCIFNNADEILRKSKEVKRKEWINEEILEMMNERRKYKNATDQRGIENTGN